MKITKNGALYAAQSIYPNAKKIKKINKGYSHEIFEVETEEYPEKIIIKATNNENEKFSLKKEERIHKIIQEKGIPCPRVIFTDTTKKKIPFHFTILSYAEGIDLETIWNKITRREQEKISEKIGEIAGKIHKIKYKEYGYLTDKKIETTFGFSLKQIGEKEPVNPATLDVMVKTFHDFAMILANKKISEKIKLQITSYLIKNQSLAESFEKPSLIHGDFSIINIRVKKIKGSWEICSLLDFEYAASMQREYDFIKLHREGFFNKPYLKENLLKGYKKYHSLPDNFEEKVKFLRITRDVAFLGLLYRIGNKEKAKEVLDYIMREVSKNEQK